MNLRPYLQYNRKISCRLTSFLAKTQVHPIQITVSGIFMGLLAAWVMSQGTKAWMLSGALFLHVSFILDNCDGDIARLKSLESSLGKWLDVIGDLLVEIALWAGLTVGSLRMGTSSIIFFFLAAAIVGSVLSFLVLLWERKVGVGDSVHVESKVREKRKDSTFFSILETLSRDGDCVILVWLVAILGRSDWFLMGGAVYMNGLWMTRFFSNHRYLLQQRVKNVS